MHMHRSQDLLTRYYYASQWSYAPAMGYCMEYTHIHAHTHTHTHTLTHSHTHIHTHTHTYIHIYYRPIKHGKQTLFSTSAIITHEKHRFPLRTCTMYDTHTQEKGNDRQIHKSYTPSLMGHVSCCHVVGIIYYTTLDNLLHIHRNGVIRVWYMILLIMKALICLKACHYKKSRVF